MERRNRNAKKIRYKTGYFPCSECDHIAKRKGDLISHMRTHTGDKPFRCQYCPYAAAQSSALRRHLKKHLKCPHCGCSFQSEPEFYLHELTHGYW
uniref:C2H2-type domain-containing protein n=1 Tax=viral metagenome TaxID=1070528 RepID=A0A6C0IXC2_9ZZZZ